MFSSELAQLRKLGVRHVLTQAMNFAMVISTALMMWKGLGILTGTESPIVVVLSESMEPAIKRGDLLFLSMPSTSPLQIGDITVYQLPGQAIPIVHRVVEQHSMPDSIEQFILTKGDNNRLDDVGLYNGVSHLKRTHLVGKVQGYVPYVGYVTIAMNADVYLQLYYKKDPTDLAAGKRFKPHPLAPFTMTTRDLDMYADRERSALKAIRSLGGERWKNIVKFYELNHAADGRPWLLSEPLLPAMDLRHVCAKYDPWITTSTWIDETSFEDVILQVSNGLKYIHRAGLVHRDLKKDNILIKGLRGEVVGSRYVIHKVTYEYLRLDCLSPGIRDQGREILDDEHVIAPHAYLPPHAKEMYSDDLWKILAGTCQYDPKIKCVGAETSTDVNSVEVVQKRCKRCERDDQECLFIASRRMGRPRRLPKKELPSKGAGAAAADDPDKDISADVDVDGTQEWEDEPAEIFVDGIVVRRDEVREWTMMDPSFRFLPEPTSVPSYGTPPIPFWNPDEINFDFSAFHPDTAPIASTSSGGSPPAAAPFHLTAPNSTDLTVLAQGYLDHVHSFLPILPSNLPDLIAHLESSTTLLTKALKALVFPGTATSYTRTFGTTIADYQAAIMNVHLIMADLDPDGARKVLVWLGNEIVRRGWDRLDEIEMSKQSDLTFAEKDAVRRLFWEVWTTEVLIATTTGVRTFVLNEKPIQVLTLDDDFSTLYGEPFSLKIRAISLLRICTEPPEGSISNAINSRLESLTSLSLSLSMMCHQSYLSLISVPQTPRNAAAREAAFIGTIMSSAAMIWVHTSSFASHAFQCAFDPTVSPSEYSLKQIAATSSTIFNVFSTSLTPQVPASVHCPYLGCAMLVASHGVVLSLKEASAEGDWLKEARVKGELELAEKYTDALGERWRMVSYINAEIRKLRGLLGWRSMSESLGVGALGVGFV
ncbi:signal peptidase, endoplasmic reticulum-type [Pseudohyphozyma bogoriensis]|nr:signal peptidase, endoplasmic reticulum-type [Pseudohyphozyma bogoriensis]